MLYKIFKNLGPPRGGPLKKISTLALAIARHGGPPINFFVIPTLVARKQFSNFYRKTSNTSPRLLLEQMPYITRLVLETRLLLKHRQLATLNSFVYVHIRKFPTST